MTATYSLAEVAQQMRLYEQVKDPVRWLSKEINTGRIQARKIGKSWRMTEQDISDALDAVSNRQRAVTPPSVNSGLSKRSRQLRVE